MNTITSEINKFLDRPIVQQFELLVNIIFWLVFLTGPLDHSFIKFPVILIASSLLLINNHSKIISKVYWFSLLSILGIDLFIDYTIISNHGFAIFYLVAIILVAKTINKQMQARFIKGQLKFLLAFILFFSGLQKFLSPTYMDGSFFNYLYHHYEFANFIFKQFPEYSSPMEHNVNVLKEFINIDPLVSNSAQFQNLNDKISVSTIKYFSIGVAAMEVLIGILVLFSVNKIFFHGLIFGFILSILIVRQESGFLAVVALILLIITDLPKMRKAYLISFFLLISSILVGFGFS